MSQGDETAVLNNFKGIRHNGKDKGWSSLLLVIGICTTIGTSVPVGYNIGVINAPSEYMQDWCNQTLIRQYDMHLSIDQLQALWASVISIFLIGGALGSLGGAYVADRIGRRGSYLVCCLFFILAAVGFQFCRAFDSVGLLIIGRFLVGLASGLTTTIVPMYLIEIAPSHLRGTFAVLCSMGVTGGVVVGQVVSLQEIFGTELLWHYALSAYVILVMLCTVPLPWFPESPKYLYIIANRRDDALNELRRLRNNDPDCINDEIRGMENTMVARAQQRSLWSVLRDPVLFLPLILVCALQGGQQLSGINAVFYYSVQIFVKAGFSPTNAKWANLAAGCLNLTTAFFGPLIMTRVNRRPLIFWSCLISGFFLFQLTFVVYFIDKVSWFPFACIAAVLFYIFFYQIGLGPIPYFIGSELFEVGPRPAAMAMGSLASWTCNFIVGMTFPTLQSLWGAFVFLPFAIVCVLLAILLRIYLPETRGKDASEIAPLVSKGFNSRPNVPDIVV